MTAPASAAVGGGQQALDRGPFSTMPGFQVFHLPEWAYGMVWQPYTYDAPFLPLAANAQGAVQPIQIESNMHFIICGGSFEVLDVNNANPQAWPLMNVNLVQSGSGRSFMQAGHFIPAINLFGIGEQMPWSVPAPVPANGQFSVIVNNLTAIAWNVYFAFHGFALLF